jgi:hypothetical protein
MTAAPYTSDPVAPTVTVLAVGTDDWGTSQVATRLQAAGATVAMCHDVGSDVFPCRGARGDCPIDRGVDVVVTMRSRPSREPAPGEFGVICGLRAGLPVVVGGLAAANPFEAWSDHVAVADGDLVDACLRRGAHIDLTRKS